MLAYEATCPHCGHNNIDMYLEETDGWMECDRCGKLHQFTKFARTRKAPMVRMDVISKNCFSAVPVGEPVAG